LKWYFEYFRFRNITKTIDEYLYSYTISLAATKGNLEIIKLAIIKCGFLYNDNIGNYAAKSGNLEILE
jgi:hypothetical protein